MKKNQSRHYAYPITVGLLVIAGIVYYFLFSSMTGKDDTQYVYVDRDDTMDSVFHKLERVSTAHGLFGFRTLARHFGYEDHIHTGRYAIEPSDGALTAFRHVKNGMQTPLNLTIPTARTVDRLAAVLGGKLMIDSAEIAEALVNEGTCRRYGLTKETMVCMFVPETYDIYWNTSVKGLLDRMQRESARFWNDDRKAKARALGLSQEEVMTMASIIDEETANNGEKPMIAGMYYNRLKTDMPLQADPTVKFALGDFSIRRIYNKMLAVDSPYNTYRNTGLPPGPIRIPSVVAIDAVLNMKRHDYLYMCANEDFSGTHVFAKTYEEHLKNAARYSAALNKRGIK